MPLSKDSAITLFHDSKNLRSHVQSVPIAAKDKKSITLSDASTQLASALAQAGFAFSFGKEEKWDHGALIGPRCRDINSYQVTLDDDVKEKFAKLEMILAKLHNQEVAVPQKSQGPASAKVMTERKSGGSGMAIGGNPKELREAELERRYNDLIETPLPDSAE